MPPLLSAGSDLDSGYLAHALRPVGFTPPELEVARLAAAWLGRSDIAKRLYVSPETVKRQLRIARSKLGVSDPRDAELLRRRLADLDLLHDDTTSDHDHPPTETD